MPEHKRWGKSIWKRGALYSGASINKRTDHALCLDIHVNDRLKLSQGLATLNLVLARLILHRTSITHFIT